MILGFLIGIFFGVIGTSLFMQSIIENLRFQSFRLLEYIDFIAKIIEPYKPPYFSTYFDELKPYDPRSLDEIIQDEKHNLQGKMYDFQKINNKD
jgi:hypothetical protein